MSRKYQTEADIQAALTKTLKTNIIDPIWDSLVEDGRWYAKFYNAKA